MPEVKKPVTKPDPKAAKTGHTGSSVSTRPTTAGKMPAPAAAKAAEAKKPTVPAAPSAAPSGSERSALFQKVLAFIPGKVNNKTVVAAFEAMRTEQKLLGKKFDHLDANRKAFDKHKAAIEKHKGYVEDQNNYTDVAYGSATMQYSGCEVFATYNALFNLHGKHIIDLPDMIAEYEKDGMVMNGNFGTSPKAIADFLTRRGYHAELETESDNFDKVGKDSESLILTMYNDASDISQEVHTINISKGRDGKFTAHNTYCNGKVLGPFASISETISNINNGKAKGISLIGIRQTGLKKPGK